MLVTRPQEQAAALCRLLAAEGATAFRLPAIEIVPSADRHELKSRLGAIESFDLVIFVSANAVRFGAALLGTEHAGALAAVGPATHQALRAAGFRVSVVPERGFDSESLLAHPALLSVQNRRVLLIKGSGGRDLLADELAKRGAALQIAEVYQRRRAAPSAADLGLLEREFAAGAIHVITATSLEVGESLLALASPALRAAWDRVHWLVPSERVAAGLRQQGLNAPVLRADSAQDLDLVAAIVRWRRSAES